VESLNKGLEEQQSHEEIVALIKQQERDYQISLSGKLPSFNVIVPESLTKQKFLELTSQFTKSRPIFTQKPICLRSQSSGNSTSTAKKSWRRILSC
jgi:hypothetical protein